MKKNYTLKLLLKKVITELEKEKIPEAKIEGEHILGHLLQCKRTDLYFSFKQIIPQEKVSFFYQMVKQRKKRIPFAYISGEKEFMGLNFLINQDVFIPRPETEILVEETIKIVHSSKLKVSARGGSLKPKREIVILDLGTGSGNIAISLVKYLSGIKIVATDISKRALEIAQKNAEMNDAKEKIIFLEGNLFEPLTINHPGLVPCPTDGRRARSGVGLPLTAFDVIVSNPPYIADPDLAGLEPEVFYEPKIAFYGGKDGLEYYREIIPQAKRFLHQQGYLLVEIGCGQKEKVEDIFLSCGYREIKVIKDYSNIDRVIVGKAATSSVACRRGMELTYG